MPPVSDYQQEVHRLIETFVAQLSDLWRRAAADALGGLNSGVSAVRGRGPGRPRGSSNAGLSVGGSRRKGEKRSSDELDGLADRFHEFVIKNPGLRIEQINKELGTTTKDLALPIKKLMADGVLKGKGEKRSRTYTASEGKRKKS
jgi:hypothetical protein